MKGTYYEKQSSPVYVFLNFRFIISIRKFNIIKRRKNYRFVSICTLTCFYIVSENLTVIIVFVILITFLAYYF